MRATTFNIAMVLDRLAVLAPPCLYAFGIALLVVKLLSLSAYIPAHRLALAALGVLTICLLVTLFIRKKWFSREYADAWLDLKNHAGGTIIAGEKTFARVRPGLYPEYLAKRLVLPLVFVAAAIVVPEPTRAETISGAGMERALARMEREITDAAVQDSLTSPDAEALRRQLERLRELSQNNPEAAAEALASLPQRLEDAQARRLDGMVDAMDKTAGVLSELERSEADGSTSPLETEESMAELFNSLDRLVAREGGMDKLSTELREALAEAMRQAGASNLRDMSGGIPGMSGVSRETLERIMQNLSQSGQRMEMAAQMSLERRSAAGSSIGSLHDALNRLQASANAGSAAGPGAGGVDRGRGDALMVFGEESRQGEMRFEHRPLPPGELSLPDQVLRREREALAEDAPPEEFRPSVRTGAEVGDEVYAGGGIGELGPARARVAERYFSQLGEKGGQSER